MLELIGTDKKNILEVCCGSGRILAPLAKAGHQVTGFDANEFMMAKIEEKVQELTNIKWYKTDAVTDDWGKNYEFVVLAGNIMINIETDMDYKEAQELFIQKAYDSLKHGGSVYLDFELFLHPDTVFGNTENRVIFEGTDKDGNFGTIKILNSDYNRQTQICKTNMSIELQTAKGEMISRSYTKVKHIPTLENVTKWLDDTGFSIKDIYGDYQKNEISKFTHRAIIVAQKGGLRYEVGRL
jgi:SAM-dependent methyltransferase